MILVIEECDKCNNQRKFVKDSPRHKSKICGNCWDWQKYPPGPLDLCGGKI
jgi:recombinational DNA repair protein (RecF pathway)